MSVFEKPVTGNLQAYHQISRDLDDSVTQIETYGNILTEDQTIRLRKVTNSQGSGVKRTLDISEVDRQYELFLKMQEQVVDQAGTLFSTSGLRDIGVVTSALSNLISLFLRAKKELNAIKAEADLKDAVLTAVTDLDESAQQKFFDRLEELAIR